MARRTRREIPADLARGRQRFRAWRRTRKAGKRIPDRLWSLALQLAGTHGVCRTATVLGLDYYSLKRRAEAPNNGSATTRTFVELTPSPATTRECVIEFQDAAGASMRVQLLGYEAPDVVALSRSFWSAGE